jgi:hypothetical protein
VRSAQGFASLVLNPGDGQFGGLGLKAIGRRFAGLGLKTRSGQSICLGLKTIDGGFDQFAASKSGSGKLADT